MIDQPTVIDTKPRDSLDDRRLACVRVNYVHLLELASLCITGDLPQNATIRVGSPLPKDVRVVSVHECWESRGFVFVLTSPEFEPVPDGEMMPQVPGWELTLRRRVVIQPAFTATGGTV